MNKLIRQIFNYSFQIMLFLFLLILLLKEFFPTDVSLMININWFMIAVIVLGISSILFPLKGIRQIKKPSSWRDYLLILFLGILGALLIFLKLNNLGRISYFISILGGLIIILLSWILLKEKD